MRELVNESWGEGKLLGKLLRVDQQPQHYLEAG